MENLCYTVCKIVRKSDCGIRSAWFNAFRGYLFRKAAVPRSAYSAASNTQEVLFVSNHRPTPRSGPREDARRRDYDYDEPRSHGGSSRSSTRPRPEESRSQASRVPGRPASDRPSPGRPSSSRPAAERSNSGRPPSNRPSAGRPAPGRGPSGRSSSGRPASGRRPVKRRRRSLLPLVFFLALLAVMALILRSCLSSDEGPGGGSGSYQLNFSSNPLIIGETGEATLEGLPEDFDGDILWSSSAAHIVTASGSGKTCTLTAKSKGSASIVAIVDGDETFSNTIQIIEPGQVISELTLNQTTATILSGNTLQLTASVTKADQSESGSMAVAWASSNVSVARVTNDGLVTARDVGTAYITATLGNQTASCAITVEKNPDGTQVTSQEGYEAEPEASGQNPSGTPAQEAAATPPGTSANSVKVTSLALNQTFGFLSVGETLTLGATVAPSGTPIAWSSSNPTVAAVSTKGIVTAKNPGTALISATAGNLSASYDLTVSPAEDTSGSTGAQGPSGDEQVYPEE